MASVERAWCPEEELTVTFVGCPEDVIRRAIKRWSPILDGAAVEPGAHGDIHIELGDASGRRIGKSEWFFTYNVMDYARIVVEECDDHLIGHEIGHALGFGHATDPSALMFEDLNWDAVRVDQKELDAYELARSPPAQDR